MKVRIINIFSCYLFVVYFLLVGCQKKATAPVIITVFSGISLQKSLLEIKEIYTQQNPEVKINLHFGNSGNNQQAIEQGAKADIYITGSSKFMDKLEYSGLLLADSRKKLLVNQMVLIAPKHSSVISNFKDLTKPQIKRVAVGNVAQVAAGSYVEEILKFYGILEQVKPKFILSKSSYEVANFVSEGKANAGIMLATDALRSARIKIVAIAPQNSHTPIIHIVGILKASKNIPEAKSFIQFLQSDRAGAVFVKYGFTILATDRTAP